MSMKLAKTLMFLPLLACILASSLTIIASGLIYEKDWTFNYINEPPYGNWTFARRPASPMKINASQIQIGANWTYVYALAANHTYHVYCYGDWINDGATPETDYDIYVYNPQGELEGYHTEAAGLPEHLGTTVDYPFFTPKYSGNYSFVIRNDPRESQAADAATLMVIEHVKPNMWHSRFIEGKQGNMSVENTSWAYEFTASSERIEIQVEVPDTLDMYEARLYFMANPANNMGERLNDVPLAWEPGLYGEISGFFGGYNLDSEGPRGEAYASCEYFGQDMLINYTAPYKEESLYHLVLIGELGSGNVSFRVKTNFGDSVLQLATPIQKVYPNNETVITAVSNNSNIQQAFLYYSINNWNTSSVTEILVSNRTCNGTISGQEAGITVDYRVEAFDFLDNMMNLSGSYTVKHPTHVNFTLSSEAVTLGENVSISGFARPAPESEDARVKLVFTSSNGSIVEQICYVQTDGNFSAGFKPPFLGPWSVRAQFVEDDVRYESFSDTFQFVVVEPSFMVKYSMYIYAGVGAAFTVAIIAVMIRRRQ
ncbi:hypothetical protein KAU88_05745 [Candidatus Bathyarchaeota archaeon]|nr:hypothetical protein [Candidatus Bathyarchaeota archaeon]